jgi:DNA-binding NarL/FixJ family response regulator
MTAPIRVLVLVAGTMLREGVLDAVSQTCPDVVVRAGEVEMAEQLAASVVPDVVLLELEPDLGAPGDALCLVRRLRAQRPETKVLLLTHTATLSWVRAALDAGARGVFEIDLGIAMLCRAVEVVHAGEIWVSRAWFGDLIAELSQSRDRRRSALPDETCELTEREIDVLDLLSAGNDVRAIARQLYVSPHTIRTHIRNAMRKLRAHSRLEAVVLANEAGLLHAGRAEVMSEGSPARKV